MTWTVIGRLFLREFFADLVPERVLYEFEGPRIFLSRDLRGGLLLVYLCDEDEQGQRYLVAPLTEDVPTRLEQGLVTVRQVLERRTLWVVERRQGIVTESWLVEPQALPPDVLPEAGVLLWPHLSPPLLADQPERRERSQRVQERIRKRGLWAA